MARLKVEDLNLSYTLECGQIFRVNKLDGWYFVNTMDKLIKIRQIGNVLEYYGVDRHFIEDFFFLDASYKKIVEEINKDEHMDRAIKRYYGMRLIRQDPWECLISFIFSTASNIPRIKSCLDKLSLYFGERIITHGFESYTFPRCGEINDIEKLDKTRPGFRGKFVFEANRTIHNGYLDGLRRVDYQSAKGCLTKIRGVGEKVANCVLLFSLGFMEAFPVDIWIKKIMQELYYNNEKVSNKEIVSFARRYYGPYAGYAQQYLYMYARNR